MIEEIVEAIPLPKPWYVRLGLWCLKHWRGLLIALVVCAVFGLVFHLGRASRNDEIAVLKGQNASCTANYASLRNQLAEADAAAKRAKAQAAEAEKAAQKRLRAREKYWADKYRTDPQARAWGETEVPAGVLEGLR